MDSEPTHIPHDHVRYMLCHSGLATIALRREAGTPRIRDHIDGANLGIWCVTWIVEEANLEFGAIVEAVCHRVQPS